MNQRALHPLIESFKENLLDFLHSGNYSITEELAEETKTIINGLDKLKLDNMFLNTTQKWPTELNRNEVSYEQQVSAALISQGESMMREVKNDLDRTLQATKHDEQIRRDHYNARAKLRAFIESLSPYTYGAYARLENFSHHIGATSRLNAYRNNLTRFHNEGTLSSYKTWADKKTLVEAPKFPTPDWNVYTRSYASLAGRANESNSIKRPQTAVVSTANNNQTDTTTVSRVQSAQVAGTRSNINKENQSYDKYLIERGIIPTYPDRSEYTYSFQKPKETEYISSFTINPQPNMEMFGRKFAKSTVEPRFSEYQLKYQFPDGSKMERLPWLKRI